MGKASLIHDTIKERLCEDDSLPLCERPFLHILPQNKVRIMFIQQSRTPTLLASPPLRFPSLTLTHLALWATPAVRSGQKGIRWRCDEQKLLMPATHIQMRIMKPTHECRHHGRATTSAPPPVLFSAYLSSEIQRGSTSARHIEDGCPSGRGMITQSCSRWHFLHLLSS